MGWVRVRSAEVRDGDVTIAAEVAGMNGACFGLKDNELEDARKVTHFHRPVKTDAQKHTFAKHLTGKYVNIKSLGGRDERSLVYLAKTEKGKAGLMGKDETVKWEWSFRVKDRKALSLRSLDPALEGMLETVEQLPNVGHGGFKGWGKLKWGEGDKEEELTIMARFRKALAQGDHFNAEVIGPMVEMIMALLPEGTEYLGREIKE
jgi:hypothetical protein